MTLTDRIVALEDELTEQSCGLHPVKECWARARALCRKERRPFAVVTFYERELRRAVEQKRKERP
jgi:hypothetical protein